MYQQRDELIKNHREDSEGQEGGLMYEIPGSAMCPVLPMEKYIAKLNPNNPAFFFQCPLPRASVEKAKESLLRLRRFSCLQQNRVTSNQTLFGNPTGVFMLNALLLYSLRKSSSEIGSLCCTLALPSSF